MTISLASFVDELCKIAAETKLTPEEQRKQMLQFAGLGSVATPLISGAANLITHRKVSPWAPMRRWIPAQMMTGALAGGAVPAVQHLLARSNLAKARQRLSTERELRSLAPELANASPEQKVTLPRETPEVTGGI
jgi:hypothetical protein